MVLGAYVFYWLNTTVHLNTFSAFGVSLLLMALWGASVYLFAFRRLIGAVHFILVIATFGLSIVVVTAVEMIWGPASLFIPPQLGTQPLSTSPVLQFSQLDLLTIACVVAIVVVVEFGLKATRVGMWMRAVASDPLLAAYKGINVHAVAALAWAIASLTACAAGVAFAMRTNLDPTNIQSLGLVAFPAILLGGLDSIKGVLLGGLLVALAQTAATTVLGGTVSDVVAYSVMLVVLLILPTGLFGSKAVVRL
jgi:branched-chain amino acid transport system permease protein